jgi:quercetin dioxygenase-like cupin family protein
MTESIWFTDLLVRIHITPEDTDGAYALLEILAPSGHVTPPHIHEHDAESLLVLEGEITLHTKDGPTVVRPGQAGHVPAGQAHTLCVTSSGPARAVVVSVPSGFVDYIRACGRPAEREALPTLDGPPDVDLLLREAPAHGMTVLGAPGVLPADLVARV